MKFAKRRFAALATAALLLASAGTGTAGGSFKLGPGECRPMAQR